MCESVVKVLDVCESVVKVLDVCESVVKVPKLCEVHRNIVLAFLIFHTKAWK